ncbi:MAG: hypothetical protein NT128_01415 [Proteobacteria bacterium]|nr:hypothetical protein [Pseudomonadota bacterium]
MSAPKLLELSKNGVGLHIQTLSTTKLICMFIDKGEFDPLKNMLLLALSIYPIILELEIIESESGEILNIDRPYLELRTSNSKLKKSLKQLSNFSNYSELPYCKKMLKCLQTCYPLNIHNAMKAMFTYVGLTTRFDPNIENKITGLAKRIIHLQEQSKKKRLLEADCNGYVDDYLEMQRKFSSYSQTIEEFNKTKTVEWQNFPSLLYFFNTVFWPCMEFEISFQELQSKMAETEQTLEETPKPKIAKPKIVSTGEDGAAAGGDSADASSATCEDMFSGRGAEAAGGVGSTAGTTTCKAKFSGSGAEAARGDGAAAGSTTREAKFSAAAIAEFMSNLKIDRQVDFDETLKRFQRYLEAGIERSKSSIEITFRDPNQKLRKIYCDPPHGSQLRKAWPAWRHHMIRGLEAAGFEF